MEFIEVTMAREGMEGIPEYPLPAGYSYRMFKSGDVGHWVDIEVSAGEFKTPKASLEAFRKEFAGHEKELAERCFFLLGPEGKPVGTAQAWYSGDFQGKPCGRLHWVAVRDEYQGKGLGKPLVSLAMRKMASLHDRAYLTTQTTSWIAIRIYLDFGFKPVIVRDGEPRGWGLLAKKLGRPELATSLQLPASSPGSGATGKK